MMMEMSSTMLCNSSNFDARNIQMKILEKKPWSQKDPPTFR